MSLRPKRSSDNVSPNESFADPLKDYSGPSYADELERSLAEDAVTVMQTQPFKMVSPSTTISACMKTMVELSIASLLVGDDGHLVGVLSERDVLAKVAENYESLKDKPVSDFMTRSPASVYETDTPAKAMNLMAVSGFRHVPILDVDDKVVGIVGPRRVTRYLEQHFA